MPRLIRLTPREEKVLRLRFGIGDGVDHTLEEVGQRFDVTRERIRQIELQALRRLTRMEVCSLQEYHRHSPRVNLPRKGAEA